MINELCVAIEDRFDSSSLPDRVSGLYYWEVPEEEKPEGEWITYFIVSNPKPSLTTTSRIESPLIQFSIFSDSDNPYTLNQITDELKALFDDSILTIEGANCISVTRNSDTPAQCDPDGGWMSTVDYLIELNTTR